MARPTLISRAGLGRWLDELEASGETRCACLPPGTPLPGGWDWLPPSARTSGTGLALIEYSTDHLLAISPPFPVPVPASEPGRAGGKAPPGNVKDFTPGPGGLTALRTLLGERHVVAIVLLRLGHYSVGIADDEMLLVPRSGHRYVHGRHRAGGQSQHRYEHNRDVWIRELYDELCRHCRPRLDGSIGAPRPDWVALGGDRIVLSGFVKRCKALSEFKGLILPWRIPVERPGQEALHSAVRSVWSSRIYEKPADGSPGISETPQ